MRSILSFILLSSVVALTACKSAQIKPEDIDFQPTVLTFKYDASQISEGRVRRSISDAIEKGSGVREKSQYRQVGKIPSTTTPGIKGQQVSTHCNNDSDCSIRVTFHRGEKLLHSSPTTKQILNFPLSIVRDGDFWVAKLEIIKDVKVVEENNPIFIPYDPMLSARELSLVLKRLSEISPVAVFGKNYEGVIDSKLEEEIVSTNLKRAMNVSSEVVRWERKVIGDVGVYDLAIGDGTALLLTDTYPTSSGTQVAYEFRKTFHAYPDGQTDYSEDQISAARKSIESAVNQ